MKKENKNKIGIALMLMAIVLFAWAITYAFFSSDVTEEQEKLTVTTGTLALTFSDNNTGITANELQLGEETYKEFKIENTGTLPVTTNMLWNNLINTYLKTSLSYTFQYKTSETGEWETTPLASGNIPRSATTQDFNLVENITIPAHTTYYYRLTIRLNDLDNVDQTQDTSARLTSNFKLGNAVTLSDVDKTLLALGKFKKEGKPNFTNIATEDETAGGLYSLADDYGTSYYYRGAVTDNYVKFANKYWRIIRVNGDGSLRMIYDGTVAHKNGEGNETFEITGVDGSTTSADRFINNGATMVFNSNHNDNAYVGWMYGQTEQSGDGAYDRTHTNTTNAPIKDTVNTWYDDNLASYDQYIADAVYCADRSMPGSSVSGWSEDTGLGYGGQYTAYGASARSAVWNSTTQPKFKCTNKNDAFTVSDSVHGNAIGTSKSRKIGLITADEIVTAGSGKYNTTNRNYYLYKSSNFWYWSLSPYVMNASGYARVFFVGNTSNLGSADVSSTGGAVAPVISIKAEYARTMIGSGTASSPFQISGVE